MRKRFTVGRAGSRRMRLLAGSVAGTLLVAGAAFAYLSGNEVGTGYVEISGDLEPIIVTGTTNVAVTIDGPVELGGILFNPNHERVGVSRIEVTILRTEDPRSCDPDLDFEVEDAVPSSPFVVPGKVGRIKGFLAWGGATIKIKDQPWEQGGCLGQTLYLRFDATSA